MRLREGDHQRLLAFYRLAYSRLCIIRLMFCAIHRSRLRARRPHLEWWRGLKVGGDASVSKCVWEGDNCTTGPVPILKTPGPGQDPALVKLSYCLGTYLYPGFRVRGVIFGFVCSCISFDSLGIGLSRFRDSFCEFRKLFLDIAQTRAVIGKQRLP